MARKTRTAYAGGGVDPGKKILWANHDFRHVRLDVTRESLGRALALLSRLAWALEKAGFAFEDGDVRGEIKLIYLANKMKVAFHVVEAVERREVKKPDEAEPSIFKDWSYHPTGRLRFVLDGYLTEGMRKAWNDGTRQKLEGLVEEIVAGCVACAESEYR